MRSSRLVAAVGLPARAEKAAAARGIVVARGYRSFAAARFASRAVFHRVLPAVAIRRRGPIASLVSHFVAFFSPVALSGHLGFLHPVAAGHPPSLPMLTSGRAQIGF